ncbi:MAG: hypothetical protein K0Q77_64 [Anaerosporomusa subterranea]|jgi:predicted SprT family Zn-dependent metalloprotease|nr:hypothetical protein [Anaerosporomusa subterranea]
MVKAILALASSFCGPYSTLDSLQFTAAMLAPAIKEASKPNQPGVVRCATCNARGVTLKKVATNKYLCKKCLPKWYEEAYE